MGKDRASESLSDVADCKRGVSKADDCEERAAGRVGGGRQARSINRRGASVSLQAPKLQALASPSSVNCQSIAVSSYPASSLIIPQCAGVIFIVKISVFSV